MKGLICSFDGLIYSVPANQEAVQRTVHRAKGLRVTRRQCQGDDIYEPV